ncbi:hypothetical protein D918_04432 [Trichuris suis]|nr:hypothetical protein D918_04432 [Trichuris suis]
MLVNLIVWANVSDRLFIRLFWIIRSNSYYSSFSEWTELVVRTRSRVSNDVFIHTMRYGLYGLRQL